MGTISVSKTGGGPPPLPPVLVPEPAPLPLVAELCVPPAPSVPERVSYR
ncbi:MAG: hypothetical protein HUU21_10010 [Polyangiaceae bacterium]|nr:hypothetical protein [Polyangiaceae bacterium]